MACHGIRSISIMQRTGVHHLSATVLTASCIVASCLGMAPAAEIIRLSERTWDDAAPQGKEVDCIYDDWVLRNDQVVAVIADAIPARNANMTVRNVRGAVIDLTLRGQQNDQLSAYYPLNALYELVGPVSADGTVQKDAPAGQQKDATLTFRGPAADKRSTAEVIYSLPDGARWLKITTRVTNTSDAPLELNLADAIRADGEFDFGQVDSLGLFWAYDSFWRQAYGAMILDPAWQFVPNATKRGEHPELRITSKQAAAPLAPGETRETVRYLIPAANTLDLQALARELRGETQVKAELSTNDPLGPVEGAEITVKTAAGETIAHGRTGADGRLSARLPAGSYQVVASALGRGEKMATLDAAHDCRQQLDLPAAGFVAATITGPAAHQPPARCSSAAAVAGPIPILDPTARSTACATSIIRTTASFAPRSIRASTTSSSAMARNSTPSLPQSPSRAGKDRRRWRPS